MVATTADSPDDRLLLLVLGAGASKEVGLPTGQELTGQIAKALDIRYGLGRLEHGDDTIANAFRELERAEGRPDYAEELRRAGCQISAAMPQALSIDNYIDNHRDNALIERAGKLAIARCILRAEKASTLFFDRSNVRNKPDFAKLSETWFNGFFKLLVENRTKDELIDRLKRVVVISFNYDRCVEFFLYWSLQNYFGFSEQAAADHVKAVRIFHPYGTLGPVLPQQNGFVEFGLAPSPVDLLPISKRIKTFTEGTDESSSDIAAIRSAVCGARRIVFLGFAFHPLNMQLLIPTKVNRPPHADVDVYGTTYRMSESNKTDIATELTVRLRVDRERVNLRSELTSAALIPEYWRKLSLISR